MSDRGGTGFLDTVYDRTFGNLRNLRGVWRDIAASARGVWNGALKPELSGDDIDRLRSQFRDCLDGKGGQVSARARAAALGRTYLSLNGAGRERFLRLLATEFDIDRAVVHETWERLRRAQSDDEQRRLERSLREALSPPRIELLTQVIPIGLPDLNLTQRRKGAKKIAFCAFAAWRRKVSATVLKTKLRMKLWMRRFTFTRLLAPDFWKRSMKSSLRASWKNAD